MTISMKQPHEGITSTDRDDWLLSLDEQARTHREWLMGLAWHLYSACLVGNPTPIVQRMYERISPPQIGDLVVEMTTRHRRTGDDPRLGFGILIERRQEWWESDEDWKRSKVEDDTLTDADRSTDEAWYVQYGSKAGDVCRWTNSTFIAIPAPVESFQSPIGTPDGTGVLITKDSLLSGLADSGFMLRKRQ